MRKVILTLFTIVFISGKLLAQNEAPKNLADSLRVGWWDKKTQFGINLSQAYFNSDWKGGGVNNINLGFLFGHRADYHRGKGIWSNDLQLQYGILRQAASNVKSLDRIFFDSKYAHKISDKWNWFAGVNLQSQFAPGYSSATSTNPISDFFSPLYISEGLGVEYRPNKFFNVQIGGATMRQTIVTNSSVITNLAAETKATMAYGIPLGKTFVNEMGTQIVANYNKDIAKNINLKWRYQGFLAFANSNSKTLDSSSPVNLSHRLDATLTAKVNKYINVNLTAIVLHDKHIVDAWQFSDAANIGLLYTF